MLFLGIDASTKTVGLSLIDDDGKLIYINHIDLSKIDNILIKAQHFKNELLIIKQKFNLSKSDHVILEAPLEQADSESNLNTINTLIRFNVLVRYICLTEVGIDPILADARTVRKYHGIVIPELPSDYTHSEKKRMIKNIMIEFTLANEQLNVLGYEHTRNKNGNWKNWCGDRADSYILALYGFKNKLRHILNDKNSTFG